MIKIKPIKKNLSVDDMVHIMRNPQNKGSHRRRSLAELDDVIDELIERNPDFVEKLNKIIEKHKSK